MNEVESVKSWWIWKWKWQQQQGKQKNTNFQSSATSITKAIAKNKHWNNQSILYTKERKKKQIFIGKKFEFYITKRNSETDETYSQNTNFINLVSKQNIVHKQQQQLLQPQPQQQLQKSKSG